MTTAPFARGPDRDTDGCREIVDPTTEQLAEAWAWLEATT